ncbi:MAG TPA: Hsp20/alpha crystallin family protein [Devosia sp.]|nr:Hsp20/alpha crystallin family protein [Devosia sp.]
MANPMTDLAPVPRLAPFDSLRRQIDQVFADFTKGVGFTPLSLDEADYEFRPDAELHDDGARTTIRVELPGVDVKDVSVQATNDVLEISGEKRSETKTKKGDRYRSERTFGSFYRAFQFPFAIDPGKVEASFDKGVLTVTLPTPAGGPAAAGKKIAIKS